MTPALAASVPTETERPATCRVILADPDAAACGILEQALATVTSTSVIRVGTRADLEMALQRVGADLVLANTRLGTESALQALARVRSNGDHTPFIVYSSLRHSLMRVLVSEAGGALLSSRVVHLGALMETAAGLIERHRTRH